MGERHSISKEYKRGIDSERKARTAIEKIWFVANVIQTAHHSHEDTDGKDMIVIFAGNDCTDAGKQVFVQVKSSYLGIKSFLKNGHCQKKDLLEKKLILINGQQQEELIRMNFTASVITIDNYWRKKGMPILAADIKTALDSLLYPAHIKTT